jgi:ribosomal protein S18 acetylase RimI-like enzyme
MVNLSLLDRSETNSFYQVFSQIMQEGYDNFSPKLIQHFLNKDYSINVVNLWIERNFRRVMLAKDEGVIVGFLVGDYTYGGVGFISWVGVIPAYRNRGIGRLLYQNYERFAQEKKAHLIELFTYEKKKHFYEQLGFYEIGRREEGFYGHQNIIMNKKIGEWNDANLQLSNIY